MIGDQTAVAGAPLLAASIPTAMSMLRVNVLNKLVNWMLDINIIINKQSYFKVQGEIQT